MNKNCLRLQIDLDLDAELLPEVEVLLELTTVLDLFFLTKSYFCLENLEPSS